MENLGDSGERCSSWASCLFVSMLSLCIVSDTSVISEVCEPLYFRTTVELLLKVKLLVEEKPDCLKDEDLSQLSDGYINIATVSCLTVYFKTKQIDEHKLQ